jgi:hypothetical protein
MMEERKKSFTPPATDISTCVQLCKTCCIEESSSHECFAAVGAELRSLQVWLGPGCVGIRKGQYVL